MGFQDKLKPIAPTTPATGTGFQSKLKSLTGQPTYNVPAAPIDHAARLKQYQAEADVSNAEATQANSFWGKTKAFGKALGKSLVTSEAGLGESIGNIAYANSKQFQTAQETAGLGENVKAGLIKAIREGEMQGKDMTHLKQVYNEQEKNVTDTNQKLHALVQMPSTEKVVGQLGGTALDLLTAGTYGKAKTAGMGFGRLSMAAPAVKTAATVAGVPELGAIAGQKAAGLFTVKGAGNVAKGAGIGYASDVAMGMQGERGEDRTGVKALIPGLGTVLGGSIPAVSEAVQTVKNVAHPEVRIAEKRMAALRDLETKNVKIATVFDAADRRGIDVRKTLAETNLLNGAISPDGRISSDKALANFHEFIAPYEGQVKDALEKEGRSVQINQLVGDAKSFINESKLSDRQKVELQQELASQLEAFSEFRGKAVPVIALHDTKVALANSNNYLNPGKNIVDKEAARFFKDLVEKNTSSMDVAKYNGELSKYYTVRDALEKMDRAVVNGGRMGKYFSSLIGSGVGGMVGGPLGAVAGAEIGAKARGGMMSRAFGSDIKTGLTPTSDLLGALKPKATGKAAIPDISMPRSQPKIPDVVMPSFKTGAIPLTTKTETAARKPMEKLVGVKSPFERDTSLSPEYSKIEGKAFDKIKTSESKLISDYFAKNGKVINTDNFRPLFSDVGYKGSNAAAVQEPSSYLAKKAYTEALKNPEPLVTFTAGGSGTGKSSALNNMPSMSIAYTKSAAIVDSNLSSYSSAMKKVEEAHKAGKAVIVQYVYRDPVDSFTNGVVKRMLTNKAEAGRLVPSKVVAGNHIDSLKVVGKLEDEGVAVHYIDNSFGAGKQKLSTREEIEKKANYPSKAELTARFNAIAKDLLDQGKITPEQYEGYVK